jgi:AcrR family transcriptional regulator
MNKSEPKIDRRITRTKEALHLALLELVKEKGYACVSVEDITQRANLGRATFYLHYKDKEDLLLEGLEPRLNELIDNVSRKPLILWYHESQGNLIRSIFETVKENEALFSLITLDQSNKVYDRFRQMMGNATQRLIENNPWVNRRIGELTLPVDFLINYFSGAMWACITWWASEEYSLSIEEMTKSFYSMFTPGLLRIFRVKRFEELVPFPVK